MDCNNNTSNLIMEYCCDIFQFMIPSFAWFKYDDDQEGTIYLMPCIETMDGEKYRVNHCPSCGKEVRGIMIPEADFKKAFGK